MGGGFVVLTGEVGTGKTTICNSLLGQIPDDVDIAYLLNPKLNTVELLASMCDELGITYPKYTIRLKVLNDLLNQHLLETHAKGRRTVLIIDEAQNLNLDVLEQIRLLTNLETSTTKLLQIILIGQPELRDLLDNKKLRQLNQRITARYHLTPLSLKETQTYIGHRLKVSEGRQDIFNSAAIKRIYKLASGTPRLINILCDRSLLGAYSLETQTVTREIVNKSAQEVMPTPSKKILVPTPVIISLLALLILLIGDYGILLPLQKHNVPVPKETATGNAAHTKQLISPKETLEKKSTSATNNTVATGSKSFPTPKIKSSTIASKKHVIDQKQKILTDMTASTTQPSPKTTISETPNPVTATPKEHPKAKIKATFPDFIKSPTLTMEHALNIALHQWKIAIPENFSAECLFVQKSGLRCLPGKSSWQRLINLQRPAILEFTLANQEKRFTLLTDVNLYQVVLQADQEYIFPIQDILPYWKGVFLTLWKPPSAGFRVLYPGQNSNDILWLRKQLDKIQGITETVSRPSFYDDRLKKRVKNFQRQQQIIQDGLVGPLTVIQLQNSQLDSEFPRLR
jgi:general secretion pathway protein A